jgi:hypothetical protein
VFVTSLFRGKEASLDLGIPGGVWAARNRRCHVCDEPLAQAKTNIAGIIMPQSPLDRMHSQNEQTHASSERHTDCIAE